MIRARFSSAAERDVAEAQHWYAAQSSGLEFAFRDELDRVLIQIRTYPESSPVVHQNVRRANLRRFPFSLFYTQRVHHVFILGVVHHARHPRRWMGRW